MVRRVVEVVKAGTIALTALAITVVSFIAAHVVVTHLLAPWISHVLAHPLHRAVFGAGLLVCSIGGMFALLYRDLRRSR